MSKQDAEFLDRLRSLSIDAAHELLSGVDRLRQLREELVPPGAEEDAEKRRAQLSDFAYMLAKAEVEHAEKLLSLSHRQADMLFDHVRSLVRRYREGGKPTAKVLTLLRRSKEPHYFADLDVHNGYAVEAFPRFDFKPFRAQDGSEASWLIPQLELSPTSLPARAAGKFVIRVEAQHPTQREGVFFGEVSVHLSGDATERHIAQYLLRLQLTDFQSGGCAE